MRIAEGVAAAAACFLNVFRVRFKAITLLLSSSEEILLDEPEKDDSDAAVAAH